MTLTLRVKQTLVQTVSQVPWISESTAVGVEITRVTLVQWLESPALFEADESAHSWVPPRFSPLSWSLGCGPKKNITHTDYLSTTDYLVSTKHWGRNVCAALICSRNTRYTGWRLQHLYSPKSVVLGWRSYLWFRSVQSIVHCIQVADKLLILDGQTGVLLTHTATFPPRRIGLHHGWPGLQWGRLNRKGERRCEWEVFECEWLVYSPFGYQVHFYRWPTQTPSVNTQQPADVVWFIYPQLFFTSVIMSNWLSIDRVHEHILEVNFRGG